MLISLVGGILQHFSALPAYRESMPGMLFVPTIKPSFFGELLTYGVQEGRLETDQRTDQFLSTTAGNQNAVTILVFKQVEARDETQQDTPPTGQPAEVITSRDQYVSGLTGALLASQPLDNVLLDLLGLLVVNLLIIGQLDICLVGVVSYATRDQVSNSILRAEYCCFPFEVQLLHPDDDCVDVLRTNPGVGLLDEAALTCQSQGSAFTLTAGDLYHREPVTTSLLTIGGYLFTFNPDNISPGYLTTLLPGVDVLFTILEMTPFAGTVSFVRRCRNVFRKIVVFTCIVQLNLSLVTEPRFIRLGLGDVSLLSNLLFILIPTLYIICYCTYDIMLIVPFLY